MRDVYVLRPRGYARPNLLRSAGFGLTLFALNGIPVLLHEVSCTGKVLDELVDAGESKQEETIASRLENLGAKVYDDEQQYRRATTKRGLVFGVTYSEGPSADYFAEALYRAGRKHRDIQIILHPVQEPQLSEVVWSMSIHGLEIEKGRDEMKPEDIPSMERAMSTLFEYARGVAYQR